MWHHYGVPFVSKLLFESADGKYVDVQHVGRRISSSVSSEATNLTEATNQFHKWNVLRVFSQLEHEHSGPQWFSLFTQEQRFVLATLLAVISFQHTISNLLHVVLRIPINFHHTTCNFLSVFRDV